MVLRINLKWKQVLICLVPLFQVSSSFVLTLRMVESSFLWFMTDNCDSMTRDSYRFDPQSPSTFSMYFCTGSVSKMPLGSYCFHQNPQNAECPPGFTDGYRRECEETQHNQSGPKQNKNTLPLRDDVETTSPTWRYCCSNTTSYLSKTISFDSIRDQLPDTFILLRKGGSCQPINGRTVTSDYFSFDDEDSNNSNTASGNLPDGIYDNDTKIYYCKYSSSSLPYPPTQLQVIGKQATGATISWKASSGNNIYYQVTISPQVFPPVKKITTLTTILTSLLPSTSYTITVYAGKTLSGTETYETVGTSIQIVTCQTGYGGSSCLPICEPSCDHGSCTAPNYCTCSLGWKGILCDECANGFYPNNGNCVQCPNCNHGSCSDGQNGNGTCFCSLGYYTPEGSQNFCSACSDGYIYDSNSNRCLPCDITCKTCGPTPSYCLTCKFGLTLNDGACISTCPFGEFLNNSACTNCSSECESCLGEGRGDCLSCHYPKVLNEGFCISNCDPGFYSDINMICQACNSPCSTCFGEANGNCTSCISPFVLLDSYCLPESSCLGYIDSNRICQECHPSCNTCYGPTFSQCLTCPNGDSILNGQCGPCPYGYFENEFGTCIECNYPCSTCSNNETNCLTCVDDHLMFNSNCITLSDCSLVGYQSGDNCEVCHPSCETCDGGNKTNCLSCSNSYLFNGECIESCPVSYYPNPELNLCETCPYPCLNCSGETKTCVNCAFSLIPSGVNCISELECSLFGYVENQTCQNCHQTCQTCNGGSDSNCLSCSNSFLLNGHCLTSCPSTHFGNNETFKCQPCDQSCESCSGKNFNDCSSCQRPLILSERKCLTSCPSGTFHNIQSNTCEFCSQNCLSCVDGSTCKVCDQNYGIYQGKCVKSCPNGYFISQGNCVDQQLSSLEAEKRVNIGIGIGVSLSILFLLALLAMFFFLWKRRERKFKRSTRALAKLSIDSFNSRTFSHRGSDTTILEQTLLNTSINVALPGFLLIDYSKLRIEECLGNGGAGELYIATLLDPDLIDKNQGSQVVVKLMKPLLGLDEMKTQQYFHNEISINWALSGNPHIIQMIGYCESPKCIITKLYECDLFTFLRNPDEIISPKRVCILALGIAKGILGFHRINSAHRDIKSKNILIERGETDDDSDIRPVLCDFGLSIVDQRLTISKSDGALKGLSPRYAAPEVFESIDPSCRPIGLLEHQGSDIFAFGVILWEMIMRKTPWEKESMEAIQEKICNDERLQFPSDLDPLLIDLSEIAKKCWTKSFLKRPGCDSLVTKIFSLVDEK